LVDVEVTVGVALVTVRVLVAVGVAVGNAEHCAKYVITPLELTTIT